MDAIASEVRGTKKRWLMQQRGREESRTNVEGRSHVRHIGMEDLRFAPGGTHNTLLASTLPRL
jgi:hypothetical protein